MNYKVKSVKFLLAVSILLVATVLCVLGYLDGQQWVMAASLIYGGYVVGNVTAKKSRPDTTGLGGQPPFADNP